MIAGLALTADAAAVVAVVDWPWRVVSSATVGGGVAMARSVVNLHVPDEVDHNTLEARLEALARERRLPLPCVGLATAASTAKACIASESAHGISAVAVVTVGLGNPVTAGVTAMARARLSTINTIVLVDAHPAPAALINAIITATEVKTSVLHTAGVRGFDGAPATGTSTDAVVIAASGRGPLRRFGGPISDLGWVVARAMRSAMEDGVRLWLDEHA